MRIIRTYFPFILPTILLIVVFLPFFFYIPLTGISNDTFTYYYWVFKWKAPHLTEGLYYKTDLPLGLPIILYLFDDTHPSHLYLVGFQILIFYSSILVFIKTIQKNIGNNAAFFVSVFLSLYMVDSFTLRHLTTLYTEAIYTSILIFISSALVSIVYSPDKVKFITLTFLLCLALLFRSNAIYLLGIIPVGVLLLHKLNPQLMGLNNIKIFFKTLGLVIVFFVGSSYLLTGYFNFGNLNRVSKLIEGEKHAAEKNKGEKIKIESNSYLETKKKLLIINATMFIQEKPSFYHSFIKEKYNDYYVEKIYSGDYKIFDSTVLVSDEYRDRVTKKLISNQKLIDSRKYTEIDNIKQYPLLFLNHLIYKFVNVFWRNFFFLVVFYASIIFIVYRSIKSRFTDKINVATLAISLVHLVSLLFLTVLMRGYQVRFTHVSEFVINVIIALTLYQVYQQIKSKKIATQ